MALVEHGEGCDDCNPMLGCGLGSGILAILGCYVLTDSFKVFKRVRAGGAVAVETR
jgi:hypothetical protein